MKNLTTLQTKIKITNFKGTKKKKKGFTLIELVAVLAIVAVLAAAFVPKFSGYIKEAQKVSVLNEAKNIVTAFESVSHTLTTSEAETPVSKLQDTNMPLNGISINKVPITTSIGACREILDTKNTFTLTNNGVLEKINNTAIPVISTTKN